MDVVDPLDVVGEIEVAASLAPLSETFEEVEEGRREEKVLDPRPSGNERRTD